MKFINVTGYVSSGSSAVIDYLREFENVAVCKSEIRFIRDPFGLIDLDTALNYTWENERASYMVWKFLDRSKQMARFNRHWYSPMGHSYKKFLNPDYLKLTNEYIDNLTDYKATFGRFGGNYDYSRISYICNRIRRNLEKKSRGKRKVANRKVRKDYFIHPTEEQFISATKDYLEKVFSAISDNGEKMVVLDHALPPNVLDYSDRYFDDCACIVVDRDPRDIYCTQVFLMDVIAEHPGSLESGIRFVKYYKTIKEREKKSNKYFRVRFEDLVLHYDETSKKISDFVGLDEAKHINKKHFLNPDKSCKNVGFHKQFYDRAKDAIDYIEKELKEYCYYGE